jgi:hypothetical protein
MSKQNVILFNLLPLLLYNLLTLVLLKFTGTISLCLLYNFVKMTVSRNTKSREVGSVFHEITKFVLHHFANRNFAGDPIQKFLKPEASDTVCKTFQWKGKQETNKIYFSVAYHTKCVNAVPKMQEIWIILIKNLISIDLPICRLCRVWENYHTGARSRLTLFSRLLLTDFSHKPLADFLCPRYVHCMLVVVPSTLIHKCKKNFILPLTTGIT